MSNGVVKKPFLKRGARMPVSKLPSSNDECVVQAIKNPIPKKSETSGLTFDAINTPDESFVVAKPAQKSAFSQVKSKIDTKGASFRDYAIPRLENTLGKKAFDKPIVSTIKPIPVAAKENHQSYDFDSRQDFDDDEEEEPESNAFPNHHHLTRKIERPEFSASSDSPSSLRRLLAQLSEEEDSPEVPVLTKKTSPAPAQPQSTSFNPISSRRPILSVSKPTAAAVSTKTSPEDSLTAQLESEIARFKVENEKCRKLRLERETALAELSRQKASLVIDREKFEEFRQQELQSIEIEKSKYSQSKERAKDLIQANKQKDQEIEALKSKLASVEFDLKDKTTKFRSEQVRLENRIKEFEDKNYALQEEVKKATKINSASSAPSSSLAHHQPSVSSTNRLPDGRVERSFKDGSRQVEFPSGLTKTVYVDGSTLVVFQNGDRKETAVDGTVVYHYKETGAKQTTHLNGLEIVEFPTGQIERHYPDGSKDIIFPNGGKKHIPPINDR
jgi:T-complex protein 10 C-terminus